jgi:trk system potassium uptake protein TrkA
MKIIIIGAGEVGFHIAKKLSEERHEVVIIDKDPRKIRRIHENLDVQSFIGSGTSPKLLRELGIEDADMLVAATDSDEVNLISCLLARNLHRYMIKVARVKNQEFLQEKELFQKELLGVDMIINTRSMMVETVLNLMNVPGASEVIDFAGAQVKLIGFTITEGSPLAGRQLSSMKEIKGDFLVAAILRGHRIMIPRGRDTILENDLVYIVVKSSDLDSVMEQFHIRTKETKNIMIVGGGEMGAAIANALDGKKLNVKILDMDGERCKQLAVMLKKVIVIRGDGTDRDILREENAGDIDLMIAVTGDEESNVLISLLAKDLGAKRTITRVSKLSYMPVVCSIGLDTVLNPRMSAVRAILQYIRRGKIISVAPLREEQAEAIEAEALETSDIVNIPLSKVKFPKDAILGAVIRGEEIIIPKGETVIKPNDRLIIFAMQQVVPQLENLLTVKLEYFA